MVFTGLHMKFLVRHTHVNGSRVGLGWLAHKNLSCENYHIICKLMQFHYDVNLGVN